MSNAQAIIRILIADDQELIRRGLTIILEQQPDLAVVGQAADGEQALELSRQLRPDIVLMDLKMPRLNGVQATARISQELPQTQIVVLTTYDTDNLVFDAVRAGAQAYLLKDTGTDELTDVIRGVYRGESRLDPTIARKVMTEFRRLSEPNPATDMSNSLDPSSGANYQLESLTDREAEILSQLALGKTNAEVAAALYLSEGTVRNYVSKIMAKLHANDRTQMILTALRTGIVRL